MKNKLLSKKYYESLPLAYASLSEDYRIRYINPYLFDLLKLSEKNTYIGKSLFDLFSDKDHTKLKSLIENSGNSNEDHTWKIFQIIGEDSTERHLLLSVYQNKERFVFKGGYIVVGVPFEQGDIETERANQVAQTSNDSTTEDRFEFLFNKASIGMAVLGEGGLIEETNFAFIEHLGMEKSELLGQDYKQLFDSKALEQLQRLINTLRKSNQSYVKDVITMENPEGKPRILEISVSEVCNDIDNTKKLMLFTEDVTHQQDTHVAMLQSEKLALTGRLAASLAHEINNPLQTSLGCLGLVEEMLDEADDRDLSVYIKMAIDELQRSARIVKKLRDLNRTTDLTERCPVDVREIIEGVLVLTKNHFYDKQIVPVFPYQGPSPTIMASKDQIQQVILNLVMNAIDALPNGGNIYFDILTSDSPKGVSITIRDTGDGMDAEIQKNLFSPFFTTKDDGLGLGLYICKQIIEGHAGSLEFDSEPGQGTAFTIWLPNKDFSEFKD